MLISNWLLLGFLRYLSFFTFLSTSLVFSFTLENCLILSERSSAELFKTRDSRRHWNACSRQMRTHTHPMLWYLNFYSEGGVKRFKLWCCSVKVLLVWPSENTLRYHVWKNTLLGYYMSLNLKDIGWFITQYKLSLTGSRDNFKVFLSNSLLSQFDSPERCLFFAGHAVSCHKEAYKSFIFYISITVALYT